MTPAINVMPHAQYFGFDYRATALLRAKIGARQKHLPHGNQLVIGLMARAPDLVIEKRHRDLHMNTGTITGLAIGIHRSTMPNRFQGIDAVFYNTAAGHTVNRHHKTNTTRTMLVRFGIQAILGHPFALRLLGGNPSLIICSH